MVKVYDSDQKKIISEAQFGADFLGFLYNTIIGRLLLKALFLQPWFWKAAARLQKRPSTVSRVNDYVKKYSIDRGDYVNGDWGSFYEFFDRQLKPGVISVSATPGDVIAVAEAKLLAVPISSGATFEIKQRTYNLASIVGSADLAAGYEGGMALVYRLSAHNYHRYLFPDAGTTISSRKYKGLLHTVSSISRHYPVYSINQRQVSRLNTLHFGEVVMVEVGSMMVGRVINHRLPKFERGQEKGSFEIGGSTVLVIYKQATIELNDDLKKYNQENIEVTVTIGEVIGRHV